MRLRLIGDEKMRRRLNEHARRFPGRARKALAFRAERVMTRSKKDFVPVADSTLQGTGHVRLAKVKIEANLVYGGPAAPYALAVHEHLSKHSPPSWQTAERSGGGVRFNPPGRGPKYLEKPLMEARRTLARDLARDLRVEKWRGI